MIQTNIHILEGQWRTKYVKNNEASFVELKGPSGSIRLHIPHADVRALDTIARVVAFALRMNDGSQKLKDPPLDPS